MSWSASSHDDALEAPLAFAAFADGGIQQPVWPVEALIELPDLRADIAAGDGILVRAVDRDHLAVLDRDRETARIRTIERARRLDDRCRATKNGFRHATVTIAVFLALSARHAARRDHRRWIRRPRRRARAGRCAGPRHAPRSPQLPSLSAAALSGGDRVAVARRHRFADPLGAAPSEKRPGAARRRRRRSIRRRMRRRRHRTGDATTSRVRLSDCRRRRVARLLRPPGVGGARARA